MRSPYADFNQASQPYKPRPVYKDAAQETKRVRWVACRNVLYRLVCSRDAKRANAIMNAVWPFPKDAQ